MKLVDIEQNTLAWHTFRMGHLGSSDSAAIMGCGFMTPYQLYLNKLGLYEQEQTDRMGRGKLLEPKARKCWELDNAILIPPACVVSSRYPFMAASLDGLPISRTFIVEIKTGGEKALEMASLGKATPYQYCQIQHQLAVTELDRAILFFYDSDEVWYEIEIYRDEPYIHDLIEKEKKFWHGVLNFIPPELTEKDFEQHDEPEWLEITRELLLVHEVQRTADEREKTLRDRLIALSNGNNACGGGIKLSRIPRKGNVDYTLIPELIGVDLDKYRKPTQITWRITKQ